MSRSPEEMRKWLLLFQMQSGITYLVEFVGLQQMHLLRCECIHFFTILFWQILLIFTFQKGIFCFLTANKRGRFYLQALADMKSINLFGVQQICRNSIALEQVTNIVCARRRCIKCEGYFSASAPRVLVIRHAYTQIQNMF